MESCERCGYSWGRDEYYVICPSCGGTTSISPSEKRELHSKDMEIARLKERIAKLERESGDCVFDDVGDSGCSDDGRPEFNGIGRYGGMTAYSQRENWRDPEEYTN